MVYREIRGYFGNTNKSGRNVIRDEVGNEISDDRGKAKLLKQYLQKLHSGTGNLQYLENTNDVNVDDLCSNILRPEFDRAVRDLQSKHYRMIS